MKIKRIFIHPFVWRFSGSHASNLPRSQVVLGGCRAPCRAEAEGPTVKVGHRWLRASFTHSPSTAQSLVCSLNILDKSQSFLITVAHQTFTLAASITIVLGCFGSSLVSPSFLQPPLLLKLWHSPWDENVSRTHRGAVLLSVPLCPGTLLWWTQKSNRHEVCQHFLWSTSETATWRMSILDLSFTCSPWYYCFRPAVSLGSSLFSLNPILPSALSSPFHFAASRRLHSFHLTKYCEKAQEKQLFLPVTAELIFLMICK